MLSDATVKIIGNLPAILSIREVAEFFSVRYLTIYRLIYRKRLPAYKDDEGNWCILRHDLKRFCSRHCNL
ncbi:MAG: helix-turn-helix domain-containing protein [Treponema sp.]|nr:helix-turn-helix domain-containing protein [Treponema sp.]